MHAQILGITIDQHLNWKEHCLNLTNKLNSTCYSFRIIKRMFETKTLIMIYKSNFEAVMRYGIMFYGKSTFSNRVFIIQKKVLRIILGLKYNESCRGYFKSEGILTLYGLYVYEILIYHFKHYSDFRKFSKNHSYDTRNMHLYNYPIHRLGMYEKSPYYSAIKMYNQLPRNLQIITDLKIYKNNLKEYLIQKELYSLSDF